MKEGRYFLHNGELISSGKPIIAADSRAFRYGDGFFETMKMVEGNIILNDLHFERLFSSLQLLKFEVPEYFTPAYLAEQIKQLASKNNHTKIARIRLTIFRGDGSLFEFENNSPNYIIQTWQIDEETGFDNRGLIAGIYTKARKTCDDFSHIKSNNYLPYLMGALWAKENNMDDVIILNNYNHIAEATVANIFLVNDGKIKTPALSEGCVSGVMRKYLIKCLKKEGIPIEETAIQTAEIAEAHELFVTNAVMGIKWIRQCENYHYGCELSGFLHKKFIQPLSK